jgi:hypothetical protein
MVGLSLASLRFMKIGRCMILALLAGCGAADSTDTEHAPLPPVENPDQPTGTQKSQAAADSDCPLALPGAQLRSEVTADGVALVFTTGGGDPTELRDRVQRMADHHNGAPVPASRAAVEEIDGGARVVFTPSDPAKVGVLREQIRVHGKEMASTGCAEDPAPAKSLPPASPSGDSKTPPDPTPAPTPEEPVAPDRPVTPDHPVTPPSPPPPTGEPFVQ